MKLILEDWFINTYNFFYKIKSIDSTNIEILSNINDVLINIFVNAGNDKINSMINNVDFSYINCKQKLFIYKKKDWIIHF